MRGFYFKCSQEDKEQWEAAAKLAGLSLSAWIKSRLQSENTPIVAISEPVLNGGSERWQCKCGGLTHGRECVFCGRSRKFAVKS